MPSEAAVIVENAFRDVLGFDDEALALLSSKHKFEMYCDSDRLKSMRSFIRTNSNGGLPSMTPPRTIQVEVLSTVSLGSTLGLMMERLEDYAYYRT